MPDKLRPFGPVCTYCRNALPLVGPPKTCGAPQRCRYRGSTGLLVTLDDLCKRRGPIDCIRLVGAQALDAIGQERLAGGAVCDAIDALGALQGHLDNPWTIRLRGQVVALRGGVLSQHAELRVEEGPQQREVIRHCDRYLERLPATTPNYPVVPGLRASLAASRCLIDLADNNTIGAVTFAERALHLARASGDLHVQNLALRVRARVFEAMGDSATAAAFVAMAGRLNPQGPAPLYIDLRFWLDSIEEGTVLAA